jgi:serine/threonine protein kinase
LSEIRLAAGLQHPHLVPLIAAGDVDGLSFYTMPFVTGASLRERMLAGPIPAHDAQGVLRDVAKALGVGTRGPDVTKCASTNRRSATVSGAFIALRKPRFANMGWP